MPEQGIYTGSATSATSYALSPKIHTTQRRVTSNAQCTAIAEAIIERYELNAERGSVLVPMNCGQEVWDYILVTDARQVDTRAGNVQQIHWTCKAPEIDGHGAFNMTIRFGRVNTQTIGAFVVDGYGAGIPQWIIDLISQMLDDIITLYENQNIMIENHNALRDYLIPGTDVIFQKLTVWEQLIIPTWISGEE